MRPASTLLIIILVLVYVRPGAATRNLTTHVGGQQLWEVNSFIRHLLQTDAVELQTWRIVAALVCGAIAAALSSAGGLGGGGLYVPIFNLLLGFSSKTSAALSSCMILGGTLVNLVWYARQRRPDGLGPLVDYQASLLCLPNVLLGISAGVMCNVASPSWLVTMVLIIVLFVMTFRSCRNACQRWNLETSALQPDSPLLKESCQDTDKHFQDSDLLRPLLEPQFKGLPQYPALKISLLCIIWVGFLVVQIARGSSDGENLFSIQSCGLVYWIVTSVQVPFAIIVTACSLIYLQKKNANADVMEQEDSSSSPEHVSFGGLGSMRLLPIYALIAGFLGGMLGLGGGMIISPLLLEMGMHPQVTAATCSYMVFFSSSLSVIQFWLLGRIPEEYALISAALSLVFSVIGLQVIQTIITKYGRVSLIVFSVSIVMGISAALMAFFGSWDVLIQIEQGDYMGFRSPC